MPLGVGTRVGVYEVIGSLGAGGMGEVYRARDTRLKREVALKILPASLASDPERLARFQREAEVLASLNHPNIAAIYGFEEADPPTGSGQATRALVMELVDGETLAERIGRGAIPVDDALPIARQIADALEAAHEQGIIHRDLKPANIKVRSDGTVKVLDFGLAKLTEAGEAGRASVAAGAGFSRPDTVSPTIMSPAMTGVGVLLGTAAYMSPEQSKGKPADKRSDIWAFGCVLYEMLTGRRAFEGEDVAETLAFVLTKEPAWNALPSRMPNAVHRLIRRCLQKNRTKRLAHIADAGLELDDSVHDLGFAHSAVDQRVSMPPAGKRRLVPWIAATAVLTVALAVVLTMWAPWRTVPAVAQVRVAMQLGADVSLVNQGAQLALSPAGALLAFAAPPSGRTNSQLFLRRLDQLQASVVPGTVGARDPFFSPDGQWVAFFADGKLKKVSTTGGTPVSLCEAANDRGGAWGDDGSIVFQPQGQGSPLYRVSSSGGQPVQLTKLNADETTQRWPQLLPGGKAVLYTSHNRPAGFDEASIVVQALPDGPRQVVHRGGYFGRYLDSGHILYVSEGSLFALPFDIDRLQIKGEPVPVIEDVASSATSAGVNGGALAAVSRIGTAVYLPGTRESNPALPVDWVDRAGKVAPLRMMPFMWGDVRFAPDGRRLAFSIFGNPGQADVWIYEWERDTLARFTFDQGDDFKAVWTPNGRRIAFASRRADRNGVSSIYWQQADGTGDVQRLTESSSATGNQIPTSFHPSGRFLAFAETHPTTAGDLMILPIDGDEVSGWKPGEPTVFLNTSANESEPMFSPDGRWLAYSSTESGRPEIYVRPFPGPGGKWQISSGGGVLPTWSPTHQELIYETLDRYLTVAPYSVSADSFVTGKPRAWSDRQLAPLATGRRAFDVHPAGERVVVGLAQNAETVQQDKVVLISNFFDELRRVAPPAR